MKLIGLTIFAAAANAGKYNKKGVVLGSGWAKVEFGELKAKYVKTAF